MAYKTYKETMPDEAIKMALRYSKGNPKANFEVFKWICLFKTFPSQKEEHTDNIEYMFRNGYCWYFANMLMLTFNRGHLAIVAPSDHCVWVDSNGVAYDITGVKKIGYDEELVSIAGTEYDNSDSYKHIPDRIYTIPIGNDGRKFFEEHCSNPRVLERYDMDNKDE